MFDFNKFASIDSKCKDIVFYGKKKVHALDHSNQNIFKNRNLRQKAHLISFSPQGSHFDLCDV
jgi:hypothetical protein